ncbi:phosphoglycerate dehydrogenase [Francisella orientalis]|uniref:D-3-phosphoglycerate dehydrogenase n=1 Tax=Francisella orientalis TaxID=299583 RepID=A0AAP7C6B0_9GAMM|nr:phosphoglycerate dehydrogenase [Francisella orientalis]AFJ43954.1 D-3-phosphoglycerate dehydrogenase [Francisella orientalis str. Toba 04]AHB98630.1 3-phosphoglycerate dehydrogenase [Francisella orientalis LADL 07-285A]AKN85878.1 D-3-phosphoglycerate dehydrogenase [Francisella orientalis FNO12]AKN87417.1 D-3-phosphoglycerate dehydrogenase [Francisella orientalis FNO24]AKN88954.1 D-3-phosphoglycerate dehydrogenase [Francisella orientalis]
MNQLSLNKKKIPILLLEGIHLNALESFKAAGYENIELLNTALEGQELVDKLKDFKIVGLRSRTQLTKEVLEQSSHLTAIGCFCIGTNQVDLKTAQNLGIPVFNAPFSNTRSVAELVLAEAILLIRNVIDKNAKTHRGEWHKSADNANEVRGKNLGIIGYGHIGMQLGILAESIGLNVIFYDIEEKLPLGNASAVESLETLLKNSDVVSLHVPQLPTTANMISAKELSFMKENSVLINASRGNVVDIDALVEVLKNGKLKGAAIDVFPKEPSAKGEIFESPLRGFDNVFLTPYIGGSTIEAQENIANEVAAKLIKYSDNGSTLNAVNFAELSLPSHTETHRILHIHQNIPGTMNELNKILAAKNINVEGQYLRTLENIGYVVMDIKSTSDEAKDLVDEFKKIKTTIKARFLV